MAFFGIPSLVCLHLTAEHVVFDKSNICQSKSFTVHSCGVVIKKINVFVCVFLFFLLLFFTLACKKNHAIHVKASLFVWSLGPPLLIRTGTHGNSLSLHFVEIMLVQIP